MTHRRRFLQSSLLAAAAWPAQRLAGKKAQSIMGNKNLGTIYNNDINNIIIACSGKEITPDEYRAAVGYMLDGKFQVLAQNVGMPDPVLYRSKVATPWDRHIIEVSLETWAK